MLNKIAEKDYPQYIPLARAHDCGRIYPLAIAEGIQGGDIFTNDKSVLMWANSGFAYIAGEITSDFLDEVHALMTDRDKSKRFILLTQDKPALEYFSVKTDVSIEKRYLYEHTGKMPSISNLPDGYAIKEIDKNIFTKLSGKVTPSLFWQNADDFIRQGKGYCIMHGEEIAAWAFSAAVSSDEIDIGIETAESHRQKGLAVIIAAKMVEYTISQGKNPVWACYYKNMASQRIAEKLGYIKTGECNIIKAL
ncbi:MAG: GNAT family N-acetyltransferase [Clostridia bacterium]|nr:GNAT family N-acetyltransferase [Clostridia bacterium]MBR5265763.1 GNAT family N-acetyltransferase [Clostridia bacterium]